jgi:hypothetical protein
MINEPISATIRKQRIVRDLMIPLIVIDTVSITALLLVGNWVGAVTNAFSVGMMLAVRVLCGVNIRLAEEVSELRKLKVAQMEREMEIGEES